MLRGGAASLVLVIILMTSCCKEGYEIITYSFLDSDKVFCPYKKNQKIVFSHSKGYEFNLNVSVAEFKTTQVGPENCGDNYYSYDSQDIILESDIPELRIQYNHYALNYSPTVTIEVNRSAFVIDKKSPPHFEKLTIGDKDYKNVYVASYTEKENVTIFPTKIYYNAQYGVIQIKMTNDDTFTIKN